MRAGIASSTAVGRAVACRFGGEERVRMRNVYGLVAVFFTLAVSGTAAGTVVDSSPYGFSTVDTILIEATPDRVFEAVTRDIGSWWASDHTFSGNAMNLYMEAEPGGCFCERLDGGGGVRHMTVVYVDFGKKLRLAGALGPLQALGVTGAMTWDFTATGEKTNLIFTYIVGGYARGGLENWAAPVDGVLSAQVRRLKDYVEKGSP